MCMLFTFLLIVGLCAKMRNQRNKLLIKLSQTNKQFYNDSNHMTNASELMSEKEIEEVCDFDLHDISPIPMVSLSESLLQDCILEVGEQNKEYAVLQPYQENQQFSKFKSECVESAITEVTTTVALVHSPKPCSGHQKLALPVDSSVQPLCGNRIQIISSKVIVPAGEPENKIVLDKPFTPAEDIEEINSDSVPTSSSSTEIVCSPPTKKSKTGISAISAMSSTSRSSVSDTFKEEPRQKMKRVRDPTSMTQI